MNLIIHLIITIINKLNMSLSKFRDKINMNDVGINKNNNDLNNKIQLIYEFDDSDLSKDEIMFLLNSISKSKIDGDKLQSIFNLTLKLQYKLKKMED